MPAYMPDLPKERPPVGCMLLGGAVAVILWGFNLHSAFWVFIALAVVGVVSAWVRHRGDRRRGWTLASAHPEIIRYGRRVEARWEWIEFWVPGGGPEAFVGAESDWSDLPAWARSERDAILERLSQRFPRLTLVEADAG